MKKKEKLKKTESISNSISIIKDMPPINSSLANSMLTLDPILVNNPTPLEVQNGGKQTYYYVLAGKESTGGGCDENVWYRKYTDNNESAGQFVYCKDL